MKNILFCLTLFLGAFALAQEPQEKILQRKMDDAYLIVIKTCRGAQCYEVFEAMADSFKAVHKQIDELACFDQTYSELTLRYARVLAREICRLELQAYTRDVNAQILIARVMINGNRVLTRLKTIQEQDKELKPIFCQLTPF